MIKNFLAESEKARQQLLTELVNTAVNDVKFMRRSRMLRQLSAFESQIIKKIYDFETTTAEDYHVGYNQILTELGIVSSRNA